MFAAVNLNQFYAFCTGHSFLYLQRAGEFRAMNPGTELGNEATGGEERGAAEVFCGSPAPAPAPTAAKHGRAAGPERPRTA